MLTPPFDLISCSWPRPVTQDGDQWISEPDWDAPLMPILPQPQWVMVDDDACWHIDWCKVFDGGLKHWSGPRASGEMRGFHVIFVIRVNTSGTLIFWDDDGSIIRRNDEIVHTDRTTHPPVRHEIAVSAGDHLEIAQWQNYGGWTWGARLVPQNASAHPSMDVLLPYVDRVKQRLRNPNGPALKMYFSGKTPAFTILALYSMILNGYRPSRVLVFGEYQWSEQSQELFGKFMPFADIVPNENVLRWLREAGGTRLASLAQQYWSVMKTCIGVLYPPGEYCFLDDDVFILDVVDDALVAFREHNLVFAPDADYSNDYLAAWSSRGPLPTGRINTGLYWLRNTHDTSLLVRDLFRVLPLREPRWQWDQGFIAVHYRNEPSYQLSTQRYFYPYFDGLPGDFLGYDYASNPCGFASIHFGGLAEKPSDTVALLLAPSILDRHSSLKDEKGTHNGVG
jgi:hypothetical protein